MQRTGWARGLELVGDDERCVALVGLLPVRLLAERAGLTGGISAAMRRPGYDPDYDRGQVLVDLGLVLLGGGQAIGDFQALAHLAKLIGPVPSTPTVWRALDEADGLRVARIHQAVCRFRRLWWGMLADRPEGFPWLRVAGRELTGITVIDLDASVVKVTSDRKENAKPTDKGGVGYVPNLATCDNVDDVLVIDPRPGNATSHDAADNIATLTAAIAAIPGTYRRKVLVRLDGVLPHAARAHRHRRRSERAATGSSPSAGPAPTGRSTPSTRRRKRCGRTRSSRTAACWRTPGSPTSPACWTCRNGPRRSPACG